MKLLALCYALYGLAGNLLRRRTLGSSLLGSRTLRSGLLGSRTLLGGGLLGRGLLNGLLCYCFLGWSLLGGLLCCRTLLGYCLLGRSLFLRGYCHLPSSGLNVESIWNLDDTNMMISILVPPR